MGSTTYHGGRPVTPAGGEGENVTSIRPPSADMLKEGAITEAYIDAGIDAIPTSLLPTEPADPTDPTDPPAPPEPIDGRIVDLKQPGTFVGGDFYIEKGAFGKNGEMKVTIVFPRASRDVALALVDMASRMLHGTFKVKQETRRVSDDAAIAKWYEEHMTGGSK